jgi:hypothetical protein
MAKKRVLSPILSRNVPVRVTKQDEVDAVSVRRGTDRRPGSVPCTSRRGGGGRLRPPSVPYRTEDTAETPIELSNINVCLSPEADHREVAASDDAK